VDRVKITKKGCKPAPALLMPSPDPNISFGAILTLAAARGLIVANIDCAPADDLPVVVLRGASGWFLGNSGTRAPHCASLNQNSPALTQASNPIRLDITDR